MPVTDGAAIRAFACLTLALLIGACAASAPTTATRATVSGKVLSVATDDDGTADITLAIGDGETVVHVPPPDAPCAPRRRVTVDTILGDHLLVSALARGDQIEVTGMSRSRDASPSIRICDESDEIRLLWTAEMAPAGVGVFQGTLTIGFEISHFRPAEYPDEAWWLSPDDKFERLIADLSESVCEGGVPYLDFDLEVEGDLSVVGMFGHMGMEHRHLSVTKVRRATVDPGSIETPDCL